MTLAALCLVGESDTGIRLSPIKHDELRLEKDVSIDVERQATRRLKSAEAGVADEYTKVDEITRHCSRVPVDIHSKVRKSSTARE